MKPADAVRGRGAPAARPHALPHPHRPTCTTRLNWWWRLAGGQEHRGQHALSHIYGYAVGLDMTRRDLQNDMKKQGRPWCIGKGFDHSAPIGPITPAAQAGDVGKAGIWLQVNGVDRQRSTVDQLIWNIAETIEHLSAAWELQPGDLIIHRHPRRRGRRRHWRCAGRRRGRAGQHSPQAGVMRRAAGVQSSPRPTMPATPAIFTTILIACRAYPSSAASRFDSNFFA